MNIYIPTYRRVGKQVTIEQIPDSWKDKTYLVCPSDEVEEHKKYWQNILVQPDNVRGISNKRQWILEQAPEKLLFMDDDRKLFKKRDPNHFRLYRCTEEEMEELLERIETTLDDYVHVGVSYRLGNNNLPFPHVENSRYIGIYGLRRSVLMENNIKFNDISLMEEFHVNLSLLKLGHPNRVLTEFAYAEWHGTNAAGGCSTYRTHELQAEAAYKLAELHKPFVQVIDKRVQFVWGDLKERKDVRVRWNDAYKSSQNKGLI